MAISRATQKQKEFISGKKRKHLVEGKSVLLRIPEEMLERIENAIEDRPVRISRNTWLLEAAYAYLKPQKK